MAQCLTDHLIGLRRRVLTRADRHSVEPHIARQYRGPGRQTAIGHHGLRHLLHPPGDAQTLQRLARRQDRQTGGEASVARIVVDLLDADLWPCAQPDHRCDEAVEIDLCIRRSTAGTQGGADGGENIFARDRLAGPVDDDLLAAGTRPPIDAELSRDGRCLVRLHHDPPAR